jgi:hypothetical protein
MSDQQDQPKQVLYDDDGNVMATGAQAIAMMMAMTPPESSASPPAAPAAAAVVRPIGRAPRSRTNTRARGSRRGQRSSASSSDDPDPPSKPCALQGCNRPRAHGKRHCSVEHRRQDDRERKDRQRDRDRHDPERVTKRSGRTITRSARVDSPDVYEVTSLEILKILEEEAQRGTRKSEREHLPWQLRRRRGAPPWPDRTFVDPTIIRTRSPREVMLAA